MSAFGVDHQSSQLPWRTEQQADRQSNTTISSSELPPPSQHSHQHSHPHHQQHQTQLHHSLPPPQSQHHQLPHLPQPGPGLSHQHQYDQQQYNSQLVPEYKEEEEYRSLDSPHSQHSSIGTRRGSDMSVGGGVTSPQGDQRMTLGERRQEKRKMKRFRLTHNQTRFLMSEFARQAHPDAAHRERLAREIPGLSPRQVQVWFQNRRAKLKRMSSDDRDSMLKSRTLPEQFPILQTLHQYGRPIVGTPLASPTEYSPITEHGYRPDPLRRQHLRPDEMGNMLSPTNSQFSGMPYTPTTSGEMLSPVSSTGERTPYGSGYMTAPPLGPQQRGNPFSRPSDPFRTHANVPRLNLGETPRSISEPNTTPVRSSTPYSANPMEHGEYQLSPSYSMQGMPFVEPPRSVPEGPTSPYVHGGQQAQYGHPYPSPQAAPAAAPHRQSFPPPLGLGDYKYGQGPMTPHSAAMSGFQTAPLAPPPDFQIPQLSAPPESTTFRSSYLTGQPGNNSYQSGNGSTTPGGQDSDGRDVHGRKRSSSHPPNFQTGPNRS